MLEIEGRISRDTPGQRLAAPTEENRQHLPRYRKDSTSHLWDIQCRLVQWLKVKRTEYKDLKAGGG